MNIIPFRFQILNKTIHQLWIYPWQSKDNLWFQYRDNLILKAFLLVQLKTSKIRLFFKYGKDALFLFEESIK